MKTTLTLALLSALWADGADARELLSSAARFSRCYAQLTQTKVPAGDPLLEQVIAGTKTAVAACMEVFDKAQLNATGQIAATNEVGKNVLRTLHRLHASWFQARDFSALGIAQPTSDGDIYDIETPALYLTRAMFKAGVPYRYVVQSAKHVRAFRTNNSPTVGPYSNRPKTDYVFKSSNFILASVGDLLGVQEMGSTVAPYSYVFNGKTIAGSVDITQHHGGGILGSAPYLLMNVLEGNAFRANGGEAMPRKWARAVFSDLLCRELPVVRYADVPSFRVPSSPVPFRKTQGCVQCHASMDRMASAIRGFSYVNIGVTTSGLFGGGFAKLETPTAGPGTEWPSAPQADYHLKLPDGVLYYRNYKGALRNIPFRGLPALGNALAAEEDLFVCAAKRYYSYFVGVDVAVGDTVSAPTLSAEEALQKKHVEDLGKALKADPNQSLRGLIQKIFELPEYRNSDFRP